MANKTKAQARQTRRYRIRSKIVGSNAIPRLAVFKSNNGFYAQLISDESGTTLVSSSTQVLKLKGNNIENVVKVAEDFAQKAKSAGFTKVVFDRSGYLYHGKVKAFADEARNKGLEF
jgi:large subunit ribosomal protein L18